MATSPYLNISDLRGGINDSDSAFSLPPNQVVSALNADFREGMIGTKRKGLTPLSMSGSVFERDIPDRTDSVLGSFVGAASGTASLPASSDAAATNHIAIIRITTKAATNVNSVTLGAAGFTQLGATTNGNAGRLETWYLKNPALAGGTITVTLAGAADCAFIVERWKLVDTSVSPSDFASSTGTSASIQQSVAAFNAQFMVSQAIAWSSATTADAIGLGQTGETQQSGGNARVLGVNVKGMKPLTGFNTLLGASADYITHVWALKGSVLDPTFSFGTSGFTLIYTLMRHQPTNSFEDDELWAQDGKGRLDRRVGGVWQGGVPTTNYAVGNLTAPPLSSTNGVSLHGKFFLALDLNPGNGSQVPFTDRLTVWDGTVLRHAGMAAPPTAPAVVDTAAGGAYITTRYFRTRYTEQQSGVTVRRSEPSTVTTFAPVGNKTGATITKPTAGSFISGEGETHWEVEASLDNVLFYRIATLAVGTTTYDDLTADTVGYAVAGVLSESIGEYVPPIAARHVAVDEDRLLVAGSVSNAMLESRVSWSALSFEDGVGNDERIPIAQRHYQDLDALNGGRITHMLGGVVGSIYIFKQARIYKLVRTGQLARAYDSIIESENRGAVLRSATTGTDENGVPCAYFVDPNVGACRFASKGVEDLMQDRRAISQRINKAPTSSIIARTLFYPKLWLVWVWVSLDQEDFASYLGCFNIRTRSWTDYDGRHARILGSCLFPNTVAELRPYVSPLYPGTSLICEADAGLNDDGEQFRGVITTRPMQLGQFYKKFGIVAAALLAKAAMAVTIGVGLIRNFGMERKDVRALLSPRDAETNVVVPMDDAKMSECVFVQFEFGDPASYTGLQLEQTWTLDEFSMKIRQEEEQTS